MQVTISINGQQVSRRSASPPLERSWRRFLRAVSEHDPAAVVCTPPDAAATLAVAIAAERALETSRALVWMMERYLNLSLGREPATEREIVARTLTTIWTRVLYGVG